MNINKGHVTLLVFLDLSSAFDNADHGGLLKSSISIWGFCEGFSRRTYTIGSLSTRVFETQTATEVSCFPL